MVLLSFWFSRHGEVVEIEDRGVINDKTPDKTSLRQSVISVKKIFLLFLKTKKAPVALTLTALAPEFPRFGRSSSLCLVSLLTSKPRKEGLLCLG